MDTKHGQQWKDACITLGLKNCNSGRLGVEGDGGNSKRTFTIETFHHLLVKWIAVDDQVCAIIVTA